MTPTAQGRHCAHCNREVVDFTTSTAADLAAARAASPDGCLCGRFRQSQLAAAPQLRPKLRRFLVALVLVCGLGLGGREAWAQVRAKQNTAVADPLSLLAPVSSPPFREYDLPINLSKEPESRLIGYFDKAPEYPGGMKALFQFIEQHLHHPDTTKAGRVFVDFTVTETGQLAKIRVLNGVDPALDAEALRVVRLLPNWIPAETNGRKLSVPFTIPITFSNNPVPTPQKRRKNEK